MNCFQGRTTAVQDGSRAIYGKRKIDVEEEVKDAHLEALGVRSEKKKKKKKKTTTAKKQDGPDASADDVLAEGSASGDVSAQPAQESDGGSPEPEPQSGEGVSEQGTVVAPPQRRRKKKAVAT